MAVGIGIGIGICCCCEKFQTGYKGEKMLVFASPISGTTCVACSYDGGGRSKIIGADGSMLPEGIELFIMSS